MSQRVPNYYYPSTKCKYLPTRAISRGQFRGFNDLRRFQCFNSGCNSSTSEFALCEYCRHVPYVSSPLRYSCGVQNITPTASSNRGSFIPRRSKSSSLSSSSSSSASSSRVDTPDENDKIVSSSGNEISNKITEFFDHLEVSKCQLKQRIMKGKLLKRRSSSSSSTNENLTWNSS
ncbi:uncharacterized protein SPAPADRAFT_158397 [Spathaspora passalidarum NRRL Y-27907]|uniref:Uncharacterized protein n=1 Tax=Spathaspora passalidarum (strain NRRL Y-27907 / 11-Y1) TaxID=619300 RepID=G3AUU9_SPAPN|nr:uncharacterized protein SPAPADRAFT_158397 [Spathaspora passalidarum NRRL Y-27907]EGW30039.1 hypothetical protein SPAPADRAFT_158397 [Spathaspora passalidarum NRRL Y-27907]